MVMDHSQPFPNFFLHLNNCPEGKTLTTSKFLAWNACREQFLTPLFHSNLASNLVFTLVACVHA